MTSERTVLITGVCGGLGAVMAASFKSAGWYVIGSDLIPPDHSLSVERFVEADISSPRGVQTIIGAVTDLDGLDALVNNAALQLNRSLLETTDDEWSRVLHVNLGAAFQLMRDLHAPLARRGGSIVNISSVHAIASSENVAAYAVSKAALAALTRSAALEFAPTGVRCNAVLPGAIGTPMLLDGLSRRVHPDGPTGNLHDLERRTPLGFVASPEQIAPTIVHLADGRETPYLTGQTIVIDGGATLRLGTE